MKTRTKYILNISVILIISIAIFIYMIAVDGLNNMINVAKNINIFWALVGIFCIVAYWLLEALVLQIICKKVYPDQKYSDSFRINIIGQLFNNITPFSSGGQPVQAYLMKKEGKAISSSASILLVKFIIFQAVHVLYTLAVLIFRYEYFKTMVSSFAYLAIIGFIVNFSVICALILVGVKKEIAYSILKVIYKVLSKLHIVKNIDERLERLKINIDNFHNEFKLMKEEKAVIYKAIIITVVQLTIFFTIAYTIYRSFGFNNGDYINILCAQAFLTMIMAFIPTPGAGGVAEGGFYVIFSNYFINNTIAMAVLYWRLYTFYLPILVGAIFFVFSKKKEINENKKLLYDVNNGE